MTDDAVLLFLHIPKAAGTSLTDLVYANCHAEPYYVDADGYLHAGVYYFPVGFFRDQAEPLSETIRHTLARGDLRAVAGHIWLGVEQLIPRPVTYVTLLRDPVERAVSLYFHLKMSQTMSLADFIHSPPYREVDNGQTRRISGHDPPVGECTPAMLDDAKQHLAQRFTVVGVTERFAETAVVLQQAMGWQHAVTPYPRNRNTHRPSTATLSAEVVQLIRDRHSLDVELHRYASELLDRATAQQDEVFWQAVQQVDSTTQAWIDQDPRP